jgi:hypothetical protein
MQRLAISSAFDVIAVPVRLTLTLSGAANVIAETIRGPRWNVFLDADQSLTLFFTAASFFLIGALVM